MEYTALALLLRSFVAFVVLAFICLPARMAVIRWMPEGRMKRLLLRPVGKQRRR